MSKNNYKSSKRIRVPKAVPAERPVLTPVPVVVVPDGAGRSFIGPVLRPKSQPPLGLNYIETVEALSLLAGQPHIAKVASFVPVAWPSEWPVEFETGVTQDGTQADLPSEAS